MSRHRAEDDVRTAWQAGTREALVAAGLDPYWVRDTVLRALAEDLGPDRRDVTTLATIPAEQQATAQLVARANGVIGGLPLLPVVIAEAAAWTGTPVPDVVPLKADGDSIRKGDVVAEAVGAVRTLLVAERTALNLLCRVSGIATHTSAWVEALAGTNAKVLDTRKTTPGLRALEKYAVRCGGGDNKRMGLYDVAMIKDNHKLAAGSVSAAYTAVRNTFPKVEVQVEVTTPEEAVEAIEAGARFLLCDNMSPALLETTVGKARAATTEPVLLEATGGLTLKTARQYARTGVDYLSVGALTHSSPALDLALDLVVDRPAS
jgi:nicotinate-nucleotide pyrophosphorylase (carboxylating)